MDQIFSQINEQFGIRELPHAMYYQLDLALRFELGGEEFGTDRPMRRFAQAYERANTVSQSLFRTSPEIFLFLSTYGVEQPDPKRLRPLRACGMKGKEFKYLGSTPQQDKEHILEFGSDIFRHWDVAKLKDKQTISEILWLGIASEMKIEPSFRGSMTAYLVDATNGLVLHLYDDRGMDVAAIEAAPLRDLYKTYGTWLLDHDLAQMTAKFGNNTEL